MILTILHHPKDAEAAEDLQTAVTNLARRGGHRIVVRPTTEAEAALESRVVLALLSAPFVAWWTDAQIARDLERRHEAKRSLVIPVRVRPCDDDGWLARMSSVPADRPVRSYRDPDDGWTEVARLVGKAVDLLEPPAVAIARRERE